MPWLFMQPQGKLGLYPPCTVCHPSPPYTGLLRRAAVTVTHLCPSLAPRKSRGKWTWGIWGKAHLVVLLPCPSSRAAHQHLHEGRAIVSNLHFVYLLLLLQLEHHRDGLLACLGCPPFSISVRLKKVFCTVGLEIGMGKGELGHGDESWVSTLKLVL